MVESSRTVIPVITIDGPSGVGKGTMCRLLAQTLHWHVLDSGVLYRVLALCAIRARVPLDQAAQLVALLDTMALHFQMEHGVQRVLLAQEDVTAAIREVQCGEVASRIAQLAAVRSALLSRQQDFRRMPGLVTDGRDMGTVVFPDAQVKFFLHASPEERAKRRWAELKAAGVRASLAELQTQQLQRDQRDSARDIAPLCAASDAVLLDTSGLSIDEALAVMLYEVRKRLAMPPGSLNSEG